jgi:hypothetical protein
MTKLMVCSRCHYPHIFTDQEQSCPNCDKKFDRHDLLNPGSALGLVGLPNSGKTVYLATLHDQLMHSAPEWGVEVGDDAFNGLTRDYQNIHRNGSTSKTSSTRYFFMKVVWQKHKLDLILWDAPGEVYEFAADADSWQDETYGGLFLLSQCRSIMVSILCERMQGQGGWNYEDSLREDNLWGRFFRKLLQSKDYLKQVIVLLIGVDVYGNTPGRANRKALQAFDHTYRIFPGVLKNAGIDIEFVPLSNIGLGNTFENHGLARHPKPYNVLEPLRCIYPVYLPWWKRMLQKFAAANEEKQPTAHTKAKSREHQSLNYSDPGADKDDSLVIKILFLAANPTDTTRLRLDEEIRSIEQALRLSEFRNRFDIKQYSAVRVIDIQGYLLRHKPDIVHFSGHGSKDSDIILEDISGYSQAVSVRALRQLFYILRDNIRCVVLNACYSEQQAKAIAEHIDCVIGMSKAIGDKAAIGFGTAFYQALGYGRDVKTAFDLGCVQIDLENLNEQDTPKLLAPKCDPAKIVLVGN